MLLSGPGLSTPALLGSGCFPVHVYMCVHSPRELLRAGLLGSCPCCMGCSEGHVVGTMEAVKPGHEQEEPRQACVENQEWFSSEGPMGAPDLEAGAEGRGSQPAPTGWWSL